MLHGKAPNIKDEHVSDSEIECNAKHSLVSLCCCSIPEAKCPGHSFDDKTCCCWRYMKEKMNEMLEYEKSLPEYLSQLPYLQNRPVIKKDVVLPIQGPIFCYCNRNQCLGMHNQENFECCCTPEKMRRMEEESCYVRATGEYISKLEYLQNIPENNSPDRFPYV